GIFTRHEFPPWGVAGGQDGGGNEVRILPRDRSNETGHGALCRHPLQQGDVVRIVTSSGGGWGNPFERDLDSVRSDVRNGYVTAEAARDIYGVLVDPLDLEVSAAPSRTRVGTSRSSHA